MLFLPVFLPVFLSVSSSPCKEPSLNSKECVWIGHCLGDPCVTFNDCDHDFVCSIESKCVTLDSPLNPDNQQQSQDTTTNNEQQSQDTTTNNEQQFFIQRQADPERFWTFENECSDNGVFSQNEFRANICEYTETDCVEKYFTYPDGGNGVELCCISNANCDYDPVKNYCHPELNRCVDGSFFGCSEKAGPIFQSCL